MAASAPVVAGTLAEATTGESLMVSTAALPNFFLS